MNERVFFAFLFPRAPGMTQLGAATEVLERWVKQGNNSQWLLGSMVCQSSGVVDDAC